MAAALDSALEHVRSVFEDELAAERERHAAEIEEIRREHEDLVEKLVAENQRLVEERNGLIAQLSHTRPGPTMTVPPGSPDTTHSRSLRMRENLRPAKVQTSGLSSIVPTQLSSPVSKPGSYRSQSQSPYARRKASFDSEFTNTTTADNASNNNIKSNNNAPYQQRRQSQSGLQRWTLSPRNSSSMSDLNLDTDTNHHAELLAEIDERLSARSHSWSAPRQKSYQTRPSLMRVPSSPSVLSHSSSMSLGITTPRASAADPEELSRCGREFFRKARSLLTEDQFAQLLSSMKDLNRGQTRREEVLATAQGLFHDAQAPELLPTFEQLLQGQIPA
eukprot:CAMPEP_0171489526 /NCGR_PEP_ID=MMETSP0958-20121227/2806_1 /TAXON_ID=87120 /ORGANISM="Aurantiochytrium limacinum, Strain ATCCMYA-1381" /LENGTH=332 /DNA_ID=CAMNT_0012022749 /DNA_START=77 /DNA_END=1075 /DNA_ORIENTATION=+